MTGDGDEAQTECSFRIGAQSKRSRNAKRKKKKKINETKKHEAILD